MAKEVDAITKLYDFILWIIPKLEKYPRSQKYILADRIQSLTLDILELLIEAAYSKKKDDALRSANLKLEKLRYLIRLSKDLHFLNITSYEFSARSINDIGSSVGGWLKHAKREDIQNPL
jgi:23S rRNA-intervening sequence protein